MANVEFSAYGLARAAMRQIHRSRAKTRGALIAAPLRADATAYVAQDVVRLANGFLLICGTAGTSGTGDPTYNSAGSMTDGTVTWWPYGRKSKLNADGYPVPTITVGTSISGLVESRFVAKSPSSPVAGDKFLELTCPNVTDYAGVATQANLFNDGGSSNFLKGYTRVVEFGSDAQKLAIGLWNPAGLILRVYVDDYLLEEQPTKYVTGNPSYYTIDWSSVSGRKFRNYRIEVPGGPNTALRSVAIDALSSITPARPKGVKGVFFSDSFGGTISNSSGAHQGSWDYLSEELMRYLGVRWTRNFHRGSIGYKGDNGGTLYNALQIFQNNPQPDWTDADVVVCALGYNDTITYYQDSDLGVQAQSLWDGLRLAYPGAFIQIVGPWPASSLTGSNKPAADAVLKARQADWGDKNSAYISFLDAPTPWFGTGRIGATAGNGNSDFYTGTDNTHPSIMGKNFLVDWLEPRINANLVAAGY